MLGGIGNVGSGIVGSIISGLTFNAGDAGSRNPMRSGRKRIMISFGKLSYQWQKLHKKSKKPIEFSSRERDREGYAPLFSKFENFYVRNVFRRLRRMFFRPIVSVPGARVDIMEIKSEDHNWSFTLQKNQGSNSIHLKKS